MPKLFLAVKWDKIKIRTWSGTPLGIYSGLQNCGVDVTDIDIRGFKFLEISLKYRDILRRKLKCPDFGLLNIRYNTKILNRIFRKKHVDDNPILLFGAYNTPNISSSYIFLDLTSDYISRMYFSQNPLVKYTPLDPNTADRYVWKRRKEENEFLKKCGGVFTMSEWLRTDLIDNTGVEASKVHCVGGGCSIDVTKIDDSHKSGNKVLFVGIDFIRKGGELVVKSFIQLKKKLPNAELYIAGPETWPLAGNVPDGIVFLGRLSHDELVQYYNKCDIFVMPSSFEAYGLVFAEALIYGLPCIGRDAYAMREFIQDGENGYLINSNDETLLARKMFELLHDSKIIETVRNHRLNYIEQYSWDAVAERIKKVIYSEGDKIVDEKSGNCNNRK